MASDSFSQFIRGAAAAEKLESQRISNDQERQNLTLRAIEMERNQQEVESNKLSLKNAKFQQFLTNTQNVLSANKGPMRKIHKQHARQWVQDVGFPVSDDYWEMLDDDSVKVPINSAIARVMGVSDPDTLGSVADSITPFLSNPTEFMTQVAKFNAEMDQNDRRIQEQRENRKQKGEERSSDLISKRIKEYESNRRTIRFRKAEEFFGRIRAAVGGKIDGSKDTALFRALKAEEIDISKTNSFDDLSLIFNFMKTLDPDSVVRESEFKLAAESTTPLAAKANRWYQRVRLGDQLRPEEREELISAARKAMIAQQVEQAKLAVVTLNAAIAEGAPVDRVAQGIGISGLKGIDAVEAAVLKLISQGKTEEEARGLIKATIARKKRERKNSGTAKRSAR